MTPNTRGFLSLPVWQLLVASLALAPSPARAEQDMQQVFQQGVALFNSDRYEPALAVFEAVYAARPVPGVLYNIAVCRQELGRIPESVNAFRRYLAEEAPALITPSDRAEIEQAL